MNKSYVLLATYLLIFSNFSLSATLPVYDKQEGFTHSKFQPLFELENPFTAIQPSDDKKLKKQKNAYKEVLNLLTKGQLKEAQKKIKSLLTTNPKEPEFYNLQGLSELLNNQHELAIKSFEKAIQLDRNNFKGNLEVARLYFKKGDNNKAFTYANKALSINDQSIYVYFLLADIANKENRTKEVEDLLLIAQSKSKGNLRREIAVAKNLLKLYIENKQPKKISSLAQNLISRYPDNPESLTFLASVQVLNNEIPKAVKTLEKLLSQNKKDIKHRLLLAKLLISQNIKSPRILELFNEISLIAPNNTNALIAKTIYLNQIKQYAKAKNIATRVSQLLPNAEIADLLLADIYLNEKKLDKALSHYQKAYRIKRNLKSLNQIVSILITQGKISNAITFLKSELNKNPDNPTIQYKLATLYEKQNNPDQAEKYYLAILSKYPNNALVLNNLAWLYYKQNSPKAIKYAKHAYQNAANSTAILDTYSSILIQQKQFGTAIKVLEQATKKMSASYDLHYDLAYAYFLMGETNKAKKILQRITTVNQLYSKKQNAINLLNKL